MSELLCAWDAGCTIIPEGVKPPTIHGFRITISILDFNQTVLYHLQATGTDVGWRRVMELVQLIASSVVDLLLAAYTLHSTQDSHQRLLTFLILLEEKNFEQAIDSAKKVIHKAGKSIEGSQQKIGYFTRCESLDSNNNAKAL